MKLPQAECAVVDPAKIRDYLVSTEHPIGRFKARFFRSLGYSTENWRELEGHLRKVAASCEAVELQGSPYGRKFEIRAKLHGPQRTAQVTTIWIIRSGEDFPRFVTAYPGEDE